MSNYYYLDVSLLVPTFLKFLVNINISCTNLTSYYFRELVNPQQADITPAFLKKNIVEAVKELFGEVNAAVTIDLLKYNPQNNQVIIRVPKSHYIKIRNSLTLSCKYEGQLCVYKIHKSTPLLLALQAESRNYNH